MRWPIIPSFHSNVADRTLANLLLLLPEVVLIVDVECVDHPAVLLGAVLGLVTKPYLRNVDDLLTK